MDGESIVPPGDGTPAPQGSGDPPPQQPEQQPAVDAVSDEDRAQASPKNVEKMWKFVEKFAEKSGSYLHPQREITEFLVIGLAKHIDEVGRPLCPCNFYEDKAEEAKSSTWVCACEEMQKYKYCH
jgi:ferredoxin-thioredoxin reductase catalytic subunit